MKHVYCPSSLPFEVLVMCASTCKWHWRNLTCKQNLSRHLLAFCHPAFSDARLYQGADKLCTSVYINYATLSRVMHHGIGRSEIQQATGANWNKKKIKSLYGFKGRCLKIRDVCIDFEPYFKVHNLVSVHSKSIVLGQKTPWCGWKWVSGWRKAAIRQTSAPCTPGLC